MSKRKTVESSPLPRAGLLLLLLLGTTASGCTLRLNGWGGGASSPAEKSGAYTGSECDAYRDADRSKQSKLGVRLKRDKGKQYLVYARRTDYEERAQVTALACADETEDRQYGGGIAASSALAQDHYAFHDRRFDHLRAAIMVVDCALNDGCNKDRVGPIHWYAEKTQPKRVAASLKRKGYPTGLAKGFLDRLKQAKGIVNKRVAELDPRRQYMYVEVPRKVADDREAYYAAHAELYGKLNELFVRIEKAKEARKAPDALIDDLIGLRDDYFSQCKGEACRHDLFPIEITEQLVLLAVIAGNDALALAEDRLLREDGARIQLFAAAMLAAMMEATKEENASWKKYKKAKDSGVDEAALAAKFGEPPPVHVSSDAPWFSWGKIKRPNYLAAVDSKGFKSAFGNVRRVVKKGEQATIQFSDRITKYEDADCYETGRVVAIRRNGRLVYDRYCTNFRTKVIRHEVDPVTVPASEVKGLRPGEGVSALVSASDREGYVLSAKSKGRMTQYRGHRIQPGAKPKKRAKR
jgi:hypothetical protein